MRLSGGSLLDLQQTLQAKIDAEAEALRASIITLGPGQAMTYEQKNKEAEAFLANTSIADAEVPHLVAEAAADGMTVYEKAVDIVTSAYQWTITSSRIEALRIGHKRRVAAATSSHAAIAAAVVAWEVD